MFLDRTNQGQVVWINTGSDTTFMMYDVTIWNGSIRKLITYSMNKQRNGSDSIIVSSYSPVTIPTRTSPKPAIISLIDFGPEPLFEWFPWCHYLRPQTKSVLGR